MAPNYLIDLIYVYKPKRHLRSSNDPTKLVLPERNFKTKGHRAFSFSGPKVWNQLPQTLRECHSFNSFKTELKTFYFKIFTHDEILL